jgi:hypothetical protein
VPGKGGLVYVAADEIATIIKEGSVLEGVAAIEGDSTVCTMWHFEWTGWTDWTGWTGIDWLEEL